MGVRRQLPDGYTRDDKGRPALIGLSHDESVEWEALDRRLLNDENGWAISPPYTRESLTRNERRWLELYLAHWAACERVNKC